MANNEQALQSLYIKKSNFVGFQPRLEKQNKSLSRVGVKVWNSLRIEMHNTSKTNLKNKIHNLLLQKFSEVDDYIELPNLIKN